MLRAEAFVRSLSSTFLQPRQPNQQGIRRAGPPALSRPSRETALIPAAMRPPASAPAVTRERLRPVMAWLSGVPAALRYAAAGVALGIGAPTGALLLRLMAGASDPSQELQANLFFYLYTLVGTCLVFGFAGFYAGRRADQLRLSRDRFHVLAERDDLTHLSNARDFRNRYRRAIAHAAAYREPISLLMVDVDGLKGINDRWGHSFGSAALQHVGRILEESKRAEDLAARWGGDEFVVLMPGADSSAAERVAQRVLEQLRQRSARCGGQEFSFTVSIGIATRISPSPKDDLFELADRALYESKRAGRDQARAAE